MPQDDLSDARLEREIAYAQAEFDRWTGKDREKAHAALTRMCGLVAQRSPDQIERMERDLGLGGQI